MLPIFCIIYYLFRILLIGLRNVPTYPTSRIKELLNMPFFSFLCLFFLTCLLMYIGYWYPKKVYLGTNLPFTLLESSESDVLSSGSAKLVKKKFLYKHTPLVGSLLFTSLLQFSFLVFTQDRKSVV